MNYKRILTVQDISCVGHCSMTVALPVVSACGQECCILPSAVLSTHTGGFGKPEVVHLTGAMDGIWHHWKEAGITFDAIYVGYLGSVKAIEAVRAIMEELLTPGGKIIVDPAMADHGKLYSGFDGEYAEAMKELCLQADVMMPNITEAAMMAGAPYEEALTEAYVRDLLEKLGGKNVVLTGVGFEPDKTGAAVRDENGIRFFNHKKLNRSYHGTGDLFAACFTGTWMGGKTMDEAVKIAGDFVCKAIENTIGDESHWYGTKFETAIPYLMELLK